MQSADKFTFDNGNLEQLSGYNRVYSEYEVGTNGSSGTTFYRFELKLSDLTPLTNYCIRAYALVGNNYHYGRVVKFTTRRMGPEMRTLMATNVTKTSAKLNAKILTDDGSAIAERGFIVSTTPYFEMPTTYECGSGLGEFSVDVADMSPCSRIYYKIYARNADGLYYGNRMSVCTYDEFTDSRDNNKYKFVQIGSQVWMSENMRYLPRVNESSTGSEDMGLSNGAYYYVNGYSGTTVSSAQGYTLPQWVENVPSGTNVYNTFGVLYNVHAARQACPSGWHLPTDAEWTKMEVFLQNSGYNTNEIFDNDANRLTNNYTAKPLSSGLLWCSSDFENTVGNEADQNNTTGFSALPGGYRDVEGNFYGLGKDAYWWTKTSAGNNEGYGRSLGYTNDGMKREAYPYGDGLSVRCVRD